MWPFKSNKKQNQYPKIDYDYIYRQCDNIQVCMNAIKGSSITIEVSKPHTDILSILASIDEKIRAFINPTIISRLTISGYMALISDSTRQTIAKYIVDSFDLAKPYKFNLKIGSTSVRPVVDKRYLLIDLGLRMEDSFDPSYKPPFKLTVNLNLTGDNNNESH